VSRRAAKKMKKVTSFINALTDSTRDPGRRARTDKLEAELALATNHIKALIAKAEYSDRAWPAEFTDAVVNAEAWLERNK